MSRAGVKEWIARILLVLGGLGFAGLLVEIGVRWNFYSESGVSGAAQMHLYRGLARKWSHRGLSGVELNQAVWEASFTERGQKVRTSNLSPCAAPKSGRTWWAF